MKERTKEDINRMLKALKNQRESIPEFDVFNTNNHLLINLQMDIIEGVISDEDELYDEIKLQNDLSEDELSDVALAFQWLDCEIEDDGICDKEYFETGEMRCCKIPCNDCPFRKNSIPGWLSTYSPQDLHHLIMVSEMPFPCHLSHTEELKFGDAGNSEHPLCAGALMFMKVNGKIPRDPEMAKIVKNIDKKDCKNILSVQEFYKHHTK